MQPDLAAMILRDLQIILADLEAVALTPMTANAFGRMTHVRVAEEGRRTEGRQHVVDEEPFGRHCRPQFRGAAGLGPRRPLRTTALVLGVGHCP
jgi:hypothetical protein